jgi:hypothetical protein
MPLEGFGDALWPWPAFAAPDAAALLVDNADLRLLLRDVQTNIEWHRILLHDVLRPQLAPMVRMRLGHVVHAHALALEQDAEPPLAEAAPLAGEGTQPRPYRLVATPLRPAHRLRVDAKQPADVALGEAALRHEPDRRHALRCRRAQ